MSTLSQLPTLSFGWYQASTYPLSGATIVVEFVARPAQVAVVYPQQPDPARILCRSRSGQYLNPYFLSTAPTPLPVSEV